MLYMKEKREKTYVRYVYVIFITLSLYNIKKKVIVKERKK